MTEVKGWPAGLFRCTMNDGDDMPRKPMSEDDPLVPKQVSIPNSLKLKLKRAAEASGKSESEIVREALKEYMEGANGRH
jgi:hypothetical protein